MAELATRPTTEKIVVYCETLAVVKAVSERLTDAGIGHRLLEGKTSSSARDSAAGDFEQNPAVRVLVGSSVLERGLDLQFARVLISLDMSYNPQREHQREGRIRRIGSPHATYEHLHLLPDTPLARTKFETVKRKTNIADDLLDKSRVKDLPRTF